MRLAVAVYLLAIYLVVIDNVKNNHGGNKKFPYKQNAFSAQVILHVATTTHVCLKSVGKNIVY